MSNQLPHKNIIFHYIFIVGETKFLNANENATKVQLIFYENTVIAFVKLLNKCILCKIMTCLSISN